MRSTQLFRTFPHEVGHYVHYKRAVLTPAGDDIDLWVRLWDRYFARPPREREDFAHRYALETIERLTSHGDVPFERVLDESAMRASRLDPSWFGAIDQAALAAQPGVAPDAGSAVISRRG